MKSLTISESGRLQIVETSKPAPNPGEILVEVSHSAVNSMDVEVKRGEWEVYVRKWRELGPTLTGIEFSGIARTDGQRIRSGERVIGYSHVLNGPRTHSQFVAMPERDLQSIPASVTNESAAAIVVGGLTSIAILERIRRLKPGERCLIVGAAGGVGSCSVQLARSIGAEVTANGTQANVELLRTLGAHEVRTGRGNSMWKPNDRFDLIIDTPAILSFKEASPFLAKGGTYVSTHPEKDIRGIFRSWFSCKRFGWLMLLRSNERSLHRLLELVAQGKLKPVIDGVYPLSEAEAAFDRVSGTGKRGRILLKFN